MGNNNKPRQSFRGASVGDFLAPDQLKTIKEFALGPQTLEGKLQLYVKLSTEHEVSNPKAQGRKDRRSRLGGFINKMFNTELVLPSVGRRQQIGKAIKYGKDYLTDNPTVSVYFAAAMGAAQEYREWQALIGDLQPEQQMAILNSESTDNR